MKITHYIVNCKNYNGNKNVKFLMKANDFRLKGTEYRIISPVVERDMPFVTTADGKDWHVWSDWSVIEAKSSRY
jgi:hypothetical protein